MDSYLPIDEAAKIMQVSIQAIDKLASSGIIRSTMLNPGGHLLVNEKDVRARIPLHQRVEYLKYQHLAGIKISMSEAERRYGVLQSTISRWVMRGFISKLGVDGRKVMVDEAEVATYAEIYKNSNGGQGRWVFDQDGSPYTKRN